MNKYAKQLFDLAYEASGGNPIDIIDTTEVTLESIEKRVKRCEDLILMQAEINQKVYEILKNE